MTDRRFTYVALAVFLALSALVFAPNLAHLGDAAIGDPQSDALKHVWGQWWVHQHLTQDARLPLEMDLANYPDGGRFYCLDTVNAVLTVALRPVMNAVAAYNVLYLLHLALAGFAAFLLAREVGAGREAALAAGVIYGFSPYVLAFPVGSGVAETSFLFPLPLVLMFGLRTIKSDSWWNPVWTAALLLLQGLAAWSYGIYAGLALFFLALAFLLTRVWPTVRPTVFGEARLDSALLWRAGLFAALLVAAALPLFSVVRGTVSGEDVMYQRHLNIFPGPGPSPLEEPALTSFAWSDFFLPGEAGLRADMYTDKLLYVGYAGYLALALALWAMAWRRRGAWVFGAMAVWFFVFALGPVLFPDHARNYPAWTNPLYLAFYYAFPLFNATIHSVDRFAVAAQLALGVAAALGLTALVAPLSASKRLAVAGAACVLILGETLLLSPTPWPIPVSPARAHAVSTNLAASDDGLAVLDIPPYEGGTGLFAGDIFFQQTVHGRPIPYNLEGVSGTVRKNVFYRHIEARILRGITDQGVHSIPAESPCAGLPELAQQGFGYVVLRPDRLGDEARNEVVDLIEDCLGAGRRVGDAVLYGIPGARP